MYRHSCYECDTCECETRDCAHCVSCAENDYSKHPPGQLCDAIALFPNATNLMMDWESSDTNVYKLAPKSSGNKLRHLKSFDIVVGCDHSGSMYGSLQAAEVRMILAHLHMPSVETVGIDFNVSDDGLGWKDDFDAMRETVCGIESPCLRTVFVDVNVPMWGEPFPEIWVRTFPSPQSVLGAHHLSGHLIACHGGLPSGKR
jgi:hypothetical protein